jgi:type I restriction enzyme R subunit
MFQDEYDKSELPALNQLQQMGWCYVHGTELSPENSDERKFYGDVVLTSRLESALKRINPWISDENLRKVVRDIIHPNCATLMEANRHIWSSIVDYLSVDQDIGKGRRGQTGADGQDY